MNVFLKKKKILTAGIIVFGIALVIIALLTYYGANVGNFVMSIDPDLKDKKIYMSATSDFINPSSLLQADAVHNARDITYTMLNIEEAKKTEGSYNDPNFKYIAYTFYVRNFGSQSTDLRYYIQITATKKNVDKAVRVMLITEIDGISREQIFMAKDDVESVYEDIPECEEFVSDRLVMQDKIYGFFPEQTIKYTILMWIEGQDPDTTNEILGGQIKIQMKFSAIDSGENNE